MNNGLHKVLASAALIAVLGVTAPLASVHAEETKQTQALSPKVGNKLLELQTMVQNKSYSNAVAQAQTMLTWKDLTPYEKVQIYNFQAFANYQAGNTSAAMSAYENLIAQGSAVPQGIMESTLTILSQLSVQQENYGKALRYIDQLFGVVSSPGADLYVLRGQARYQAKQYRGASTDMTRAIDMVKRQGQTPKENWLLVWNSANFESGDFKEMSRSLRELIKYYPKDSYILQLAGAYSQAGQTKQQLALMDALYEAGIKNDAESAKNLAMLNLMHEIPYRAGVILEKEMNAGKIPNNTDNLTLLANAWFQARADEKAIPALSRAATQSGKADLYLRLGMTYYNVEKYDDAISALNTAINKGVKNKNQARQILGTVYLEQEKYDDAKREFTALGGRTGRQFLRYIESELERKEKLKQEIELKTIEKNELLESLTADEGEG